ncbi:hypothetical protein VTK26DRAFT_2350 [Humicola hyalothermophila]
MCLVSQPGNAHPMALLFVLFLVASSAAIFSFLSPGFRDATLLLASYWVSPHTHAFAGLSNAVPLPSSVNKAVADILAPVLLLFYLWQRRWGPGVDTPQWDGPGKVLLFPCRTFHSRMLPKKHSFSYSYLAVGIPVGFEGNAGGLVWVRGKQAGRFSWPSIASGLLAAWFTIDAGDYLERGKSELGLRGKLDEYLQIQGIPPATYPYAYLITAPCFLGYHFNPVSFWYLYDADKHLVAMILEANNTFNERRMYLLTRHDGSGDRGFPQAVFRQSWQKDFHVSPFNPREGTYTLAASDPLRPSMQGIGQISNTISLASTKGHVKLRCSLLSSGPAIDPCTMTAYDKFRFLASWWWVGFLTLPRIFKEAFFLSFRNNLHMWCKPEPLRQSIGRRANSTERQLEPIFRNYLQHLVEQSATPLAVKYSASGIPQWLPQRMLSRAARNTNGVAAEEFEFKVLTPAFYTRFVHYSHDLEAFFCELNDSRTIWVSRPDLLRNLALQKAMSVAEFSTVYEYTYFNIIQKLRVRPGRSEEPLALGGMPAESPRGVGSRRPGISSMDVYVLAHESARGRTTYAGCVLKLFLADWISFSSVPLLEAQRFLLQACLTWLTTSVLEGMAKVKQRG